VWRDGKHMQGDEGCVQRERDDGSYGTLHTLDGCASVRPFAIECLERAGAGPPRLMAI